MTATDQTLGPSGYVIAGIAFIWSVFQLATASVLILDSLSIRAIHLAFAMLIVFVAYPGRTSEPARKGVGIIRTTLNWMAALIGCLAAIYIVLDYAGISGRQGVPLIRDLFLVSCSSCSSWRRLDAPSDRRFRLYPQLFWPMLSTAITCRTSCHSKAQV